MVETENHHRLSKRDLNDNRCNLPPNCGHKQIWAVIYLPTASEADLGGKLPPKMRYRTVFIELNRQVVTQACVSQIISADPGPDPLKLNPSFVPPATTPATLLHHLLPSANNCEDHDSQHKVSIL
jgi:hypothetical protein